MAQSSDYKYLSLCKKRHVPKGFQMKKEKFQDFWYPRQSSVFDENLCVSWLWVLKYRGWNGSVAHLKYSFKYLQDDNERLNKHNEIKVNVN